MTSSKEQPCGCGLHTKVLIMHLMMYRFEVVKCLLICKLCCTRMTDIFNIVLFLFFNIFEVGNNSLDNLHCRLLYKVNHSYIML